MQERVGVWWVRFLSLLKRRWYIWLMLIPLALIEDRILSGVNEWLDSGIEDGWLETVTSVAVSAGSSPLGVTGLVVTVVVLSLLVHAYFETRPGRRASVVSSPSQDDLGDQRSPENAGEPLRIDPDIRSQAEERLMKEGGVLLSEGTIVELLGIHRQYTGREAAKLKEPYIGKWLLVSGVVTDVRTDPWNEGATLVFLLDNPHTQSLCALRFADREWEAQLSHLQKGDVFEALGRLEKIDPISTALSDCRPLLPWLRQLAADGEESRPSFPNPITEDVAVPDEEDRASGKEEPHTPILEANYVQEGVSWELEPQGKETEEFSGTETYRLRLRIRPDIPIQQPCELRITFPQEVELEVLPFLSDEASAETFGRVLAMDDWHADWFVQSDDKKTLWVAFNSPPFQPGLCLTLVVASPTEIAQSCQVSVAKPPAPYTSTSQHQ